MVKYQNMNTMTRRDFVRTSALAAGGLLAGCAGERVAAKRCPGFYRAALQHLGSNMWGDWTPDAENWAKSPEEAKVRPNPPAPNGKPSRYCNYLLGRDELWTKSIDHMAAKGYNLVIIDVGEGIAYPSHPELQVPGTWSVEKARRELDRIRSLGMTPVPKLNFSTCHDGWLKEYHRMVSTKRYYEVVADVIRDMCEIFDGPEIFHIGYDEEIPVAAEGDYLCVIRQGELWWHDLFYTVGEVERNGSRALMWSDKICTGREEFLKRMTKNVLLSPWYYRNDFSEKMMTWDASFEPKVGSWEVQRNLGASLKVLSEAGFDILPCTSNWIFDDASEAMVAYCRNHLDPQRVKGLCTAPWERNVPEYFGLRAGVEGRRRGFTNNIAGLDLFAAAMDRHYPRG